MKITVNSITTTTDGIERTEIVLRNEDQMFCASIEPSVGDTARGFAGGLRMLADMLDPYWTTEDLNKVIDEASR